nr:hypothetical protein [uncultured Mediterraneibacter sp.]
MMTLKEFGENLEKLNAAYDELKKKYRKPEVGKTITVAGITWRVLDKLEKGYFVISDGFYGEDRKFDGSCNNWKCSDLRKELNTDLKDKIEDELGKGALVGFERDLLSMDGQTEYGTCKDLVSLISVDEYRKYRKFLPSTDRYWWTITPDSTPCNNDSMWLRVVCPGGRIGNSYCYNGGYGVRPFCIFSSSIFESEEDDD